MSTAVGASCKQCEAVAHPAAWHEGIHPVTCEDHRGKHLCRKAASVSSTLTRMGLSVLAVGNTPEWKYGRGFQSPVTSLTLKATLGRK